MGKDSIKTFKCEILLSVTNAVYELVTNEIKKENVAKTISEYTDYNAKLIKEEWSCNAGILYSYVTITYYIEVDIYHLIKKETNVVVSQLSKIFKNKREKIVKEKIRDEIEKGFRSNLGGSILTPLAVTLKSVVIS
jgi:hypothetical protein